MKHDDDSLMVYVCNTADPLHFYFGYIRSPFPLGYPKKLADNNFVNRNKACINFREAKRSVFKNCSRQQFLQRVYVVGSAGWEGDLEFDSEGVTCGRPVGREGVEA